MIECNNCEWLSSHGTTITLRLPNYSHDALAMLGKKLAENRVSQVYVKLGYPRKPRTTGEKSQNHALNGYVSQIIKETGDEFDDVKMEIKRRAIKRGYPFRTDSFGNAIPESESNASTVECSYLIEEAKTVAQFCNVKLREI